MKLANACLFAIFLLVIACATPGTAPKMSFEEARDVVLSMQNVPLEPPPRKMDDILALLVTMRPVETTSASKLTTGLFQIRREQANISWGRAHQQSILRLMEDPGLKDADGVAAASYAHPLFWGPFVVIGAGGGR